MNGQLPEFEQSYLANTLGVAVVLQTKNNKLLVPVRSPHQAIMKGYHCSSSGVFALPSDKEGRLYCNTFDDFSRGMQNEIERELSLHSGEYTIFPLAFARELVRGGKPQLFFFAKCALDDDEIKKRTNLAEEKIEFVDVYGFTPELVLDKHQSYTYEGIAGISLALWYLRQENPEQFIHLDERFKK